MPNPDGADTVTAVSAPSAVPIGDLHEAVLSYSRAHMPERPPCPPAGDVGMARRQGIADLVAASLAELWREAADGDDAPGIALAAIGSVGRSQPGPFSDLDLVVVHDGSRSDARLATLADRLWYPLWDSGIRIDHSVRSAEQWRQVAMSDLPAAVGMLDVRFIAGDAELVRHAQTAMRSDWRAVARKRLDELVASLTERAERFGELAYLTEPDLKEAKGGIRDGVVMDALAATWLTDRPHGAVDEAMAAILDVRDAAQLVAGRRTNRLARDDLEHVAALCGYHQPDVFLAALAESAREVAYSLDTTVRRAQRELLPASPDSGPRIVRGKRTAPWRKPVADGFVEHKGEVVFALGVRPEDNCLYPFRAAAAAIEGNLAISPVTAERLGRSPAPPDPWPEEARELFMTLLSSGSRQISVWGALDISGVIEKWIPEWKAVRNRLQWSPAHRYTVDRHLIEVVARMRPEPDGLDECYGALDETPVLREARYLAGLLHDIGKRPGEPDHAEKGAQLVPAIVARMGFSAEVSAAVEQLVRQHLTLSELAVGSDPENERPVYELAAAVEGDVGLLRILHDLTRADIQALGERRWTAWRAQLTDGLVMRTAEYLRGRTGRIVEDVMLE